MRVLSGFQPSGAFHLGNYFGSIQPNVEHQKDSEESFFIIVDLHAMTTVRDADQLRGDSMEMARAFLACGFDPGHSVLFKQSEVHEHAELAWVLSTVCPMGLMERAVSYKDKVERGLEANVGLFTYPILQTADIVLYDIDRVPVGKDQKQHLEMARDITIKFNNTYGDTLRVPDVVIRDEVAVVPGIDGQKMSKSYGNTIPLFGDEAVIRKAIMRIETDSRDQHDPKDPDTCAIFQIHKLFLDESEASALADEYKNGIGYGDAKKKLFESYMDSFKAMREKYDSVSDDDIRSVLDAGRERASEVARVTMERVNSAVGLI